MSDIDVSAMAGPPGRRPARSRIYPWYDSTWLDQYSTAHAIVRRVRPQALPAFEQAFEVLQTRKDFQVDLIEHVFDDDTLDEIRRVVRTLKPSDLEIHEATSFKRFVVHDHPYFTELQRQIVPLVSAAAGEPVEVSYNFLSLYSAMGVCPVHLDSPQAKWTLDFCIDQSVEWPIYFSQPHSWSEIEDQSWTDENWAEVVKQSPAIRFRSCTLQPGQAILFSGSSQWHYRDPMPTTDRNARCDLLFFHFVPQGSGELLKPQNWARLFGIPELADAVEAPKSMPNG